MIGYIKGKILSLAPDVALIETGGIGYEIFISGSAHSLLAGKTEGAVYTYLQVREDGITLFGFSSPEEKQMFLKLTSVSGVGPKMGIAVLSSMDINGLASAIATSDIKRLSSVKGLGKKTAERIILELRESVAVNIKAEIKSGEVPKVIPVTDGDEDAIVALMTLGFNRSESIKAVSRAKEQGAKTVEDIIMLALRGM
ncbi:MAG: Holliday junction branch migration protein RuvA [Clostridia bacterium]|nr:Holliday junction branch migration protein RuvA [Clostridia bacterium]